MALVKVYRIRLCDLRSKQIPTLMVYKLNGTAI